MQTLYSPRGGWGVKRRPTRVNHISQAAFATIVVVVVVPPYTISVHLTTLDHLRLRCHDKHLVIERSLYQQEIPRPPTVCAEGGRRGTTSACDILFVYAEMETVSRSYDYDGTMMLLMMMMMLWLLKDPK